MDGVDRSVGTDAGTDAAEIADAVGPIQDVVRAEHQRWGTAAVDQEVFGTADPTLIAAAVERFCAVHLDAPPLGALFYRASAGCVLGLRLATGTDVVLKVMQTRWGAPFLGAVQRVQSHLAGWGFPCPEPVLGPTPLAPGRSNLVVAESLLADPGMRTHGSAASRRVSAQGLARQIALCRALGPQPALGAHPLRIPEGGLYPEPHSPLFDFGATAAGAEWIDELAVRARARRLADDAPEVVAHGDWSSRNVRFDDVRVLAVYDWDSTALMHESTAVGQAAATWSVTSEPGGSEFPGFEEMEAYVEDYAAAADRGLDAAQRGAARAAAAWLLAYTARCEHALSARGLARPDQDGARTRLRQAGERLLASDN